MSPLSSLPGRRERGSRLSRPFAQLSPSLPVLVGVVTGLLISLTDVSLIGSVVVATCIAMVAWFLVVGRSWPIMSPPFIVSGSYVLIALAALLILPHINRANGVSAILTLTPSDSRRTAVLFLVASVSVLAGALVHELRATFGTALTVQLRNPIQLRLPARLLALSSLPAICLIVGVGPRFVLHKGQYLAIGGSHLLVSAGTALSLPAVALTSCVIFSSRGRSTRSLGYMLLMAYATIYFSLASRQLPILPLLVLIGWLVSDHRARSPAWPRLLLALGMTVVLYPLPLTLRQLPAHGLQPYAQRLIDRPALLVSPEVGPLLNNLLFAYPLAGYVAYTELPIAHSAFWIMVSPLPGTSSGWTAIADAQRVNIYTPFNALGQLGNFGWLYLVGYLSAVGWYLAHLRYIVRKRFPVSWRGASSAAVTGIAGLFSLTSLQYSLRTSSRLVYYSLVFEFLIRLVVIPLRTESRISDEPFVASLDRQVVRT